MTAGEYPRLVDVFPELAADIVLLLRAEDADHPLAGTIEDLLFYGSCTCRPTCTNLLTAPFGSPSSWVAQLDRDDFAVVWLSLDPSATTITAIEVLDGRALGPADRPE